MKLKLPLAVIAVSALALVGWSLRPAPAPETWTPTELALIKSLSLSNLPALPDDPSNRVANSNVAAEFGQRLYFDTRLSNNGTVSCATCHQPEKFFTDGLPLAVGLDTGNRHTPSLVGLSYSPWFYWDGRKDSQWAQALAPLEAGHEHGIDRLSLARLITQDEKLRQDYEAIFGVLPALPAEPVAASPKGSKAAQEAWQSLPASTQQSVNEVFANLGKSLAAYQRKLLPGRTRFDEYADSLTAGSPSDESGLLSDAELAGLQLFVGKGQCVNCHNGPLFTNHDFHNTGVLTLAGELPPMGRYDGIRLARQDPFNCLGEFSDASAEQCLELRFANDRNDLVGAHKTPTLRNVAATAPYMHGGQHDSLLRVMEHYNEAPTSMLSHNEAKPLELRSVQLQQLVAFMATLTAPLATEEKWLQPPAREE